MKKAERKTGPAALPLSGGHSASCILHSAFMRLHRDQQGGMLEYAMVFAFVAVPLIFLLEYMLEILSDYFGLLAYYVTWPFL